MLPEPEFLTSWGMRQEIEIKLNYRKIKLYLFHLCLEAKVPVHTLEEVAKRTEEAVSRFVFTWVM